MTIVQIDDDEFFDIQNFHEDELISLKKFINKRKIKDYSDLESHTRGNRDALSEVLRILRKKKEKEKEIKKNQKNEKVSQPQTSEKSQENEHWEKKVLVYGFTKLFFKVHFI